MKKIIISLILIVSLILITGCNKETKPSTSASTTINQTTITKKETTTNGNTSKPETVITTTTVIDESVPLTEIFQNLSDNEEIVLKENGVYDIYQEESIRITGYTALDSCTFKSNAAGTRYTAMYLKDKNDVIINGNGATINVHGIMTPIILDSCTNVTIENLTINYVSDSIPSLTVKSVDGNKIVVDVENGVSYRVTESSIEFYSESNKKGGYYYTIDTTSPLYTTASNLDLANAKYVDLGNGKVEITKDNSGLKTGDTLFYTNGKLDQGLGIIQNSSDILINSLNVNRAYGSALTFQSCSNIEISDSHFGSDNASFESSIIKFIECSDSVDIFSSTFKGSLGDSIVFEDLYLTVSKVDSENGTFNLKFNNPNVWGVDYINSETSLSIVDEENGYEIKKVKIDSSKLKNTTEITVNAEDVSGISVGDMVRLDNALPSINIMSSTFDDSKKSFINLGATETVCVQSNTFNKSVSPSIISAGSIKGTYKGGENGIISITDNEFNTDKPIEIGEDGIKTTNSFYQTRAIELKGNSFKGDSIVKISSAIVIRNFQEDGTINLEKSDYIRYQVKEDETLYLASGDSITYGAMFDSYGNWSKANPSYPDRLGQRLGVTETRNIGVSGTLILGSTYPDTKDYSLVKKMEYIVGYDIVTLAYGTNDFGCGSLLGEKGDTEETSIYGALYIALKRIKYQNPYATVYIITPIDRADISVNKLGLTLDDYRNAITYMAEMFDFEVIDGKTYPLDCSNKQYLPDGVHPSQTGYNAYADWLYCEMNGFQYISDPVLLTIKEIDDSGYTEYTNIVSKGTVFDATSHRISLGTTYKYKANGKEFLSSTIINEDTVVEIERQDVNYSLYNGYNLSDGLTVLSGRELMSNLNKNNRYYTFKMTIDSDLEEGQGIYLEVGGRTVLIEKDGSYCLTNDEWNTSDTSLVKDFIRIVDLEGERLVSDRLLGVNGKAITSNIKTTLKQDHEYLVVIDLEGRAWDNSQLSSAYTTEYGTIYADIPFAGVTLRSTDKASITVYDFGFSKDEMANVYTDYVIGREEGNFDIYAIFNELYYSNPDYEISLSNDDVIYVDEQLTATILQSGEVTITITDIYGIKYTIDLKVGKGEMIKISDKMYLALSKDLSDETTSVLYSMTNGAYRCNYMYVRDESLMGDYNAIQFTLTIKQSGGYLCLLDGTNTDISSAWGSEGAYQMSKAIGPNYNGSFGYNSSVSAYTEMNSSMLKIVDNETGEDVTSNSINFKSGKSYTITYRLMKNHALSVFYTKSVYDSSNGGGSTCWGTWNKGFCYDIPSALTMTDFYGVNMEGKAKVDIIDTFKVGGYTATVMIPANSNGKWLYKTEFFYAFDKLEKELYSEGYARCYFEIVDMYGSPNAVKLMYDFYQECMKRYPEMSDKMFLLGFSRGALYAFNFALAHPECTEGLYIDAPVLDLRSWPRTDPKYNEVYLHNQVLAQYGFKSETEFENYDSYPVGKLKEWFSLGIPTLLVAGDDDTTVAFSENSEVMIDYCLKNNVKNFIYYAKVGADHHPHSFGNVGGTDMYGRPYPTVFKVYGTMYEGTDKNNTVDVTSDANVLKFWFREN